MARVKHADRFFKASTITVCAFCFIVVSGCTGCSSTKPGHTSPPQATGLVSVTGKNIFRDGKAWIPHGFMQIAFVSPPGYTAADGAAPLFLTAAQNYKPTEYTLMAQAGADSVRIQIAQTGIDPDGPYYSATFVNQVIVAAKAARAAGLTVILSDQDELQTGETNEPGLPGIAAQRAWSNLFATDASLGQDAGIMLEIYNEPFYGSKVEGPPPTDDWAKWTTSMNALVAAIRSAGAKNVLIADGLQHAEELSGAPALTDSVNQIVYGSHPYPHNYQDQNAAGTDASGQMVAGAGWDVKFGNFAATHPVIVTEWGNGYYCDALSGSSSVAFLQYLQKLGVGLTAVTWDWSGPGFGSVRQNFPNSTISSFPAAGTTPCDASGNIKAGIGPGNLVQTWYETGTPSSVLE